VNVPEARDHILILYILFFNKLRQIIPEIRSERRDLLIFIFILKTEQEVNLVWPNLYILTALHLFIPLMIMISSELCLNEYQWISKL
jgi:hypothetical protein